MQWHLLLELQWLAVTLLLLPHWQELTVEVEQPVSPSKTMPRSIVKSNRLPTDKIKLFEFIFFPFDYECKFF